MTEAHAVIAPSSLHITVECPGWIQQAKLVPPQAPTQETREGEAAHWVAMMMALDIPGVIKLGGPTPNGVTIDQDMIDGGEMYVGALEGFPGIAETRVDIKRIHETECWGTPDFWQYNPATKILRVVDYKYGHLFVEVFRNWQLIAYAAGLMQQLGLFDIDIILELVIVQPRSFHKDGPVRSWTCSATMLRAMINDANHAAHVALGAEPPIKSGPHCLHCPARVTCTTLQRTIGNIIDFTGLPDPLLFSPGDVGRELFLVSEAMDRLKARYTGLAAQAEMMLREGKAVPFYALEASQGKLDWTAPLEEVQGLATMLGKSALAPPKLITPTQAVQRKIIDVGVISAYAARSNGAMKLVQESTTKASKVFQQ